MRFRPLEPGAKLGTLVKGNCRGQAGARSWQPRTWVGKQIERTFTDTVFKLMKVVAQMSYNKLRSHINTWSIPGLCNLPLRLGH
jgi:hypothetical protein